jgi:Autotransporter beta-domain
MAHLGVGTLDSLDGALALGGRVAIGAPLEFGVNATRILGSSGRATELSIDLGYAFPLTGSLVLGPFVGVGYRAYEVDFDDVGYGPLVSGCTGVTGTTSLPHLAVGAKIGNRVRDMGLAWELRGAMSYETSTGRPRTTGNVCYGPEVGGQSYLVLDKPLGGFGAFVTFELGLGVGL